jgi:pimeloyl-ACP methyl ester carboxylesterase
VKQGTLLFIIIILLAACSLPGPAATPPGSPSPMTEAQPPTIIPSSPTPNSIPTALEPAGEANTYWVTNPASGARLYTRVFYPQDWDNQSLLPALVLMPGGVGNSDPLKATRLSGQGFVVIIFDADGRGRSEGSEDYNGFVTQDGLAAVIQAAATLPGVDTDRYGLVSYSYGVTAATGVLARHPDLPIDFYIDWEGPVDRNYTTTGCGPSRPEGIQWQPCTDEAWWSEREAIDFIADVNVPYQRIQSQSDHVQPNNNHAIDIVNAAVAGGVPWVRLNEYPPNQSYEMNDPPAMLPDDQDRDLDQIVIRYARYIIENVLP